MFVIYKIYCDVNNKSYIGITENFKRRFNVHWNTKEETVLGRTIRKYGRESFFVSKVDKAETWEEACKKEQYYISKFDTKAPNGMNMTNGGEGVYGLNHSKKTRKQMSESHKGKGIGSSNPMYGKPCVWRGKKRSSEMRKKLSESCKGRIPWNKNKECPNIAGSNNGFYGKEHSEETKRKIGEAHKGSKWTNDMRIKILKAREGCQLGEKHSQAKLTEKDVLSIREKYSAKLCSQKELALIFGLTQSMISNIIRRKSWTHI